MTRCYLLFAVSFTLHCQLVGSFDAFSGALEAGAADSLTTDSDAGETDAQDGGCQLVLPTNPCALFPHCGCAPDENCNLVDVTGRTECLPSGTIPLYHTCITDSTCQRGSGCSGGVCKPHCLADSDCPGVGRRCLRIGDPGKYIPGAASCSSGCDIFDASTLSTFCGTGLGCYMNWSDKHKCTPDCIGPIGTKSAMCNSISDCAPGYYCVENGATAGSCLKWCLGDQDCTGPATCTYSVFAPQCVVGSTQYGVCL